MCKGEKQLCTLYGSFRVTLEYSNDRVYNELEVDFRLSKNSPGDPSHRLIRDTPNTAVRQDRVTAFSQRSLYIFSFIFLYIFFCITRLRFMRSLCAAQFKLSFIGRDSLYSLHIFLSNTATISRRIESFCERSPRDEKLSFPVALSSFGS